MQYIDILHSHNLSDIHMLTESYLVFIHVTKVDLFHDPACYINTQGIS